VAVFTRLCRTATCVNGPESCLSRPVWLVWLESSIRRRSVAVPEFRVIRSLRVEDNRNQRNQPSACGGAYINAVITQ
jgi:hypothetical protein